MEKGYISAQPRRAFKMIFSYRRANCGELELSSISFIQWEIKYCGLKHNSNLKLSVTRCWINTTMLLGLKFHNTVAIHNTVSQLYLALENESSLSKNTEAHECSMPEDFFIWFRLD